METIHYDPTEKTPMIQGDTRSGSIIIKGRSYPENAPKFFDSFRTWLPYFYESAPENIYFEIDLDYMNTATTVLLYDIISNLVKMSDNHNIKVIWKYDADDIDMIEKGKDFIELLGDLIHFEARN